MNTRHYEAYAVVLVIGWIFLTALPVRAATILVTSLADPSSLLTCSLRQAITNANRGGATRLSRCMPGTRVNAIIFSPRLTGTINLQQELPAVTGNLTIIGPTGSAGVTIDGRQDFEFDGLLELTPSANLTVQNLTFSNGERFGGGAIFNNEGTLTVNNCTFSANESLAPTGGAIINDGTMLVTDSAFEANVAVTSGGAIANLRDATIEGSTFSNNRAPQGVQWPTSQARRPSSRVHFAGNFSSEGGVFLQRQDNMRIINSTFADNFATDDHPRALIVRGAASRWSKDRYSSATTDPTAAANCQLTKATTSQATTPAASPGRVA